MTVRKITKLLGDIPIRRVEQGDGLVDRANAEIGESIFTRLMTGDEIYNAYVPLSLEHKQLADTAFELNESETNELLDEVFRIREDVVEIEKETKKDSLLQAFGLLLSMFLLAIALIAVAQVFFSISTAQEIPSGYVLTFLKMLFQYITRQPVEVPEG